MPIAGLQEGEAIVVGRVARVKERPGRFPLITVDLADESGVVQAKWFGRRHLFGRFAAGDRLFVAGRVARTGLLPELNVTTHRVLREDERYVGEIVPIYAATKDLPSRLIRTLIAKNLDRLIAQHVDALPPELVRSFGFPPLVQAWRTVHAPRDPAELGPARERIVFDEFFAIALAAVLWVVGEDFGQIFTGAATDPNSGPLLVLLALAYWPIRGRSSPSMSRAPAL